MMPDVESKGVGLRSFIKTFERLCGTSASNGMIARLPADLRDAVEHNLIVVSSWYPVAWHCALHRAAQEETGRGRELARVIGREAVFDDFRGIYRFVASLLSAHTIIRQGGRLFGNYFQGATLDVGATGSTSATLRFRGCRGFDANMWANVIGGVEAAMEVAKVHDIEIVIDRGGKDGDAELDARASWRT